MQRLNTSGLAPEQIAEIFHSLLTSTQEKLLATARDSSYPRPYVVQALRFVASFFWILPSLYGTTVLFDFLTLINSDQGLAALTGSETERALYARWLFLLWASHPVEGGIVTLAFLVSLGFLMRLGVFAHRDQKQEDLVKLLRLMFDVNGITWRDEGEAADQTPLKARRRIRISVPWRRGRLVGEEGVQ